MADIDIDTFITSFKFVDIYILVKLLKTLMTNNLV